jgi:hypothetical protein
VVKNGKDLQAVAAAFAQMGGEVDPAQMVSQVKDRYLDLSRGQVLNARQCNVLERASKEELEGGLPDDMRMDLDSHITNL